MRQTLAGDDTSRHQGTATDCKSYPFIPTRFAERLPRVTHRSDGTIILGNALELQLPAAQMGEFLRLYANRTPDAVFLAERRPGSAMLNGTAILTEMFGVLSTRFRNG